MRCGGPPPQSDATRRNLERVTISHGCTCYASSNHHPERRNEDDGPCLVHMAELLWIQLEIKLIV